MIGPFCPLCDGTPDKRGVKFECKKHPFLTKEIWRAADEAQDKILDRVDRFQEDLTQEAAHALVRDFHLTDEQAYEIMGVA